MKLLLIAALSVGFRADAPGRPQAEAAEAARETPTERYEALRQEADEAYRAFVTQARAVQAAFRERGEEPTPDDFPENPRLAFLPRFLAAADDYAGTEDAVAFLIWIVQNDRSEQMKVRRTAFDRLVAQHATSEELIQLGGMFGSLVDFYEAERATELLKTLEATSPHADVKAWAVFARLKPVLLEAALDSEAYAQAKAAVLAGIEPAEDDRLKRAVRTEIGEREIFSLGMVAPDIEGVDLDGVAFKLSDYEGKVLFVDFWGDW